MVFSGVLTTAMVGLLGYLIFAGAIGWSPQLMILAIIIGGIFLFKK